MTAPSAVLKRNHVLAAAVEYAARGWPVFPVIARDKRPQTVHGHKDATTDTKCIEDWWTAASRCNVGIATGKVSGIVVVDVDGEEGKNALEALERKNGQLPRTPRARTGGGGEHIYFDARSRSLPSSVRRVGKGIDIRGDGGYVVAPPSEHRSGELYAWLDGASPDEIPLAPMPDWLIRLAEREALAGERGLAAVIRDPQAHLAAALRNESERVAQAEPGTRNVTLNAAAYALARLLPGDPGVEERVRRRLLEAAHASGLPLDEATRTITNALHAGQSAHRTRVVAEIERTELVSTRGPADLDWQPLQPLDLPTLPTFPVSSLPQRFAAWVQALSVASQTPHDLSAVIGLATVSAACGGVLIVEARAGWIEPANIYAAIVLAPGNRKSAVFRVATQPLFDFEREAAEELAPTIAETQAALRIAEERLKAEEAKSARKKGESAELTEALRVVDECRRAVPTALKLVCSDVTPEELVRQLEQQGGSIALMDAEGCGPLSIMLGRYSKDRTPQLDVFLRAHSGDPIRVDRIGRSSSAVHDPALTIGITTQPTMLEQLAALPNLRGLGLLARILWSLPTSLLGQREVRPSPVPDDIQRDYNRTVRALLVWRRSKTGERNVIRFAAEADALLEQFEKELEPRLGVGGDLELVTDWAAKLAGAIVRIAGLLHAIDHMDQLDRHPISAGTLCRAIAIGEYFLPHAKAALLPRASDSNLRRAQEIVRWLQSTKTHEFSKRDCFIALRAQVGRVAHLNPALELLEARGWIAELERLPRQGAGRNPSPRYVVNPLTHDAQNAQK